MSGSVANNPYRASGVVAAAAGGGAVEWQTGSIKTAEFTAVAGEGYFANTTSGAFAMLLPAATVGDIIGVSDYASTFDSNNLTITPNGTDKINAVNAPYTVSTEGLTVTMVYVDSTRGWKSVMGSDADATGVESFLVATGGNQSPTCGTISGDFKTHTFTSPGTFAVASLATCSANDVVDYLVVGGGGGGGGYGGGSAGAGGFRLSNAVGCIPAPTTSPLTNPTGITVSATPYAIVIGGGGAGYGPGYGCGGQGIASSFSSITSAGGGKGVGGNQVGTDGGSGGGGRGSPGPPACAAGFAGGVSAPVTDPIQGKAGGVGLDGTAISTNGGGGGGAGADGANAAARTGGAGGVGSFASPVLAVGCAGTPGPTPSVRYFAGGGGGGTDNQNIGGGTPGAGGAGGGGAGGAGPGSNGVAGGTNTGGGGGAGGGNPTISGAGGSGIVILRYKFQ